MLRKLRVGIIAGVLASVMAVAGTVPAYAAPTPPPSSVPTPSPQATETPNPSNSPSEPDAATPAPTESPTPSTEPTPPASTPTPAPTPRKFEATTPPAPVEIYKARPGERIVSQSSGSVTFVNEAGLYRQVYGVSESLLVEG